MSDLMTDGAVNLLTDLSQYCNRLSFLQVRIARGRRAMHYWTSFCFSTAKDLTILGGGGTSTSPGNSVTNQHGALSMVDRYCDAEGYASAADHLCWKSAGSGVRV